VFNHSDLRKPDVAIVERLQRETVTSILTVATTGEGIDELRQILIDEGPAESAASPVILRDLVEPGEVCVLVIPIDKEAPKGRVILPQVQALRDLLDQHAIAVVAQDETLELALSKLSAPPKLVVTDSQAFAKVAAVTPSNVWLTSFSILFARLKGDLREQVIGAVATSSLRDGDHVLVAESCTHHPVEDDIGRVKIPKWLNAFTSAELKYTTVRGHEFPEDLAQYKLVVHCGACMWNRREMLNRIQLCRRAGVPITNYGTLIANMNGILDRALEPFPDVRNAYLNHLAELSHA
jgi:[FeFe] hydrogenase H-cluster maturation GTPase HydF